MKLVNRYYNTKKATAKQQGIPFELSLSQMHLLLFSAGIGVKQIGKSSSDYCLARLGDTGPYALGNCRFITVAENLREKKELDPVKHRAGCIRGWQNDARRDALRERNRNRK
jgi:hypothetical protein